MYLDRVRKKKYYNYLIRAMRFELILEWLKVTYFTVKLSSLALFDVIIIYDYFKGIINIYHI